MAPRARRRRPWRGACALEALERAAASGAGMMEPTLELARAGGTVGEWTRRSSARPTAATCRRCSIARGGRRASTCPRPRGAIRIALGKAGLDGHINAVKLLAHACMQAGMEVILAGFKQTPAQLVEVALQEDAEMLAISSMAGAHMTIARETIAIAQGARRRPT